MLRFSLRQALLLSALLLVVAVLTVVTPALASRAPNPSETGRPVGVPQAEPTAAVPPATVYFTLDPLKDRYSVGDVVTATLQLDNLTDFFGGQLKMTFDPGSFQVIDSDPNRPYVQLMPGSLLPDGSLIAPLDNRQVDNKTGQIIFGAARPNQSQTSGSGSLVLIPFQVTATCGELILAAPPAKVDLSDLHAQALPTTPGAPADISLGRCSFVYLPHLAVGDGQ
ncbi:MAG: cohesin domain-containing protein [Anaerolineae bacterium]